MRIVEDNDSSQKRKKYMDEIKQKLEEQLSELRCAYNELHKDIEWAGLTESYGKASAVYRAIEALEVTINGLK
ncbi:hypothetical protein [Bacteroides fragilis]|uniref:hypothetical protein n=1 Tax=Bacteroides fragilis TaxID=817 RepID=UPI0011C4043F|nr:hypothetical protein [Bacteroides fragilis]